MTIKLALLKSGEEVISDIDEMMTDKKTVVGYYFTNPCRAMLTTPDVSSDSSERQPVSIKLIPWFPLAQEDKIPVVACLLYTSPSPRDLSTSRMPSSA